MTLPVGQRYPAQVTFVPSNAATTSPLSLSCTTLVQMSHVELPCCSGLGLHLVSLRVETLMIVTTCGIAVVRMRDGVGKNALTFNDSGNRVVHRLDS